MGDYDAKTVYEADPLDWAKQLEDQGVRRLHVVDLDGAKAKAPMNLNVLETLAHGTTLDIEWGGGIKQTESLQSAIDAGANRVICGSVAVDNPDMFDEWLTKYGYEHVILGADVRHEGNDYIVATHGWLKDSGLSVETLLRHFPSEKRLQVICTDISKDGMLEGPNFELYELLMQKFPQLELTLSGGVSSMDDVRKAEKLGLDAIIIGKALYENRITLNDIKLWQQN